jgi:curli biogenesis system outer membrane secretion channel CsgG
MNLPLNILRYFLDKFYGVIIMKILRYSILVLLLSQLACSASLDKSKSLAKEGATDSTKIEVIQIPYDSSMPNIAIAVEPFIFRETLTENSGESQITFFNGGQNLAAKLTTALANVENFKVIDSGLKKGSDGLYRTILQAGEVGPYVVRGTITEFTENAESVEKNQKIGLGLLGLISSIVGYFTGSDLLKYGGAVLAIANPEYENNEAERHGMVGIDFRVVEGSTGRIVKAFKSEGTFKAVSASSGMKIFGIGGGEEQFAQSVLGQAVTAALNDAVVKIHEGMAGVGKHAFLKTSEAR